MMNIIQTVRNKKTGELYTLTSMSYGGREGTTIYLVDQCAEELDMPYDKFVKNFDPVDVDITPAIESFKSMVEVDIRLKKMVFSILRRNHPGGYYSVGNLVYIEYENSLHLLPPNGTRDYGLNLFGPKNPYIIVKIDSGGVHIKKYIKGIDYLTPDKYGYVKEDYILKVYSEPHEADAFSCLIRYDQPY